MLELIAFGVTAGSVIAGYAGAKRFVAERLRFVDGAQNRLVPVIAGLVAAIVATPIVWLLPIVGTGTAVLFGLAVGLGVNSGARAIRRGDYRLLPP